MRPRGAGFPGFQTGRRLIVKLILGIGTPLLAALVWGTFIAPRASVPVPTPVWLLLQLVIFGLAAALAAAGRPELALALVVAVVLNGALMYVWRQETCPEARSIRSAIRDKTPATPPTGCYLCRESMNMPGLYTEIWGESHKQVVALLHGSFAANPAAHWAKQHELADRYRLVIPHRLGYGNSRVPESEEQRGGPSLEADVRAIADLLEPETHIVGFSYGGLVALLVAAERPELVSSVAVIEPPLYGLLRGDEEAEALIGRLQPVYDTAFQRSPDDFYYAFLQGLGQQVDASLPLPSDRRQAAQAAAKEAVPWDVELPIARLVAAPFPRLVISGSWNGLSERLCDALAREIAAERAVISGAGHGVQRTGQPFNERLELLWRHAAGGR
ncbi:MAG TPA: alpha/beta fold hydrolase [Herpetosiphonaceae bacterium]|nr:alpha/beta fold hydrolase [Herpetosiphonaceae bacterium]